MKEFLVTVPVTARGNQIFIVKALTKEAAIHAVEEGKGEFDCENLDVTNFKIDQATAEENV